MYTVQVGESDQHAPLIHVTRSNWLHRNSIPDDSVFHLTSVWQSCPKSPTGYNRHKHREDSRSHQRFPITGVHLRRIQIQDHQSWGRQPKPLRPARTSTTDLFCRLQPARSRSRCDPRKRSVLNLARPEQLFCTGIIDRSGEDTETQPQPNNVQCPWYRKAPAHLSSCIHRWQAVSAWDPAHCATFIISAKPAGSPPGIALRASATLRSGAPRREYPFTNPQF